MTTTPSPISSRSGSPSTKYDAIIIGSGFGGSMVAYSLVQAGLHVLLIERGDWVVRGPHNWAADGAFQLTPHYSTETPYHVVSGGHGKTMGGCYCVGGPSVFYGGVAFRFREQDFQPEPEIVQDTQARWPFGYDVLEPYYGRAEQLLQVAGDDEGDPTRPRRSGGYPQSAAALSQVSQRIDGAARSLGLHPFPLPLAINYKSDEGRSPCQACLTCDTFACAIGAKNDLATCVILPLIARGLELRTSTVAVRLLEERGRIVGVQCHDRGEEVVFRSDHVILSAGAIASPHLLLASELERSNPAGHTIGRYLMRHCNAMVFGFFPGRPASDRTFHKQLAIHDYYFGDGERRWPTKLGGIQQVMTPPRELVKAHLPWGFRDLVGLMTDYYTGLLVMAEDQPQADNHVRIDRSRSDRFGLPQLVITHRYSERDQGARRMLMRRAKEILGRAGAWFSYAHYIKTFSHAVGTVRMGTDPEQSALDEWCRFRGLHNLYVVDGSIMPTSAGVNPSLTIAANALRVGERIVEQERG